jgi:uncharacterized protein (DUF433 family)
VFALPGAIVEPLWRRSKAEWIGVLVLESRQVVCDILKAMRCGMDWQERIVIDPGILVGKPVVKGTRLAVEFIGFVSPGMDRSQVLRNYPGLTRKDIQACLSYASAVLRTERVYPLELAGV